MFSAFSFGKIIKVILPGAILTTAFLLILEAIWGLLFPGDGFLLAKVPADWVTAVSAGLIPLSLILGFFLNTFTWMALNQRMRSRCDAELNTTIYRSMREQFSQAIWTDYSSYLTQKGLAHAPTAPPPRASLEYYYLPWMDLTNLNYVWESYFCWYEFDINSACALVLCFPSAVLLLWVKMPQCHILLLVLTAPLLVLAFGIYKILSRAAVKNLASYEKNLMLLISGSLVKSTNDSKTKTP